MSATVLVGATGLIGQAVAPRLGADRFNPCWLLVRRAITPALPHQAVQVVDFKQLEADTAGLDLSGGSLICSLGTTLRSAGSADAFIAVDRDLVAQVAHWARDRGVRHCLAVSSVGADADSRQLYLRTKGQAEQELIALSFPRLTLMRPSLLLGDRQEFRLGERLVAALGRVVSPLLVGRMSRYQPVHAEQIARVLVHQAATEQGPVIDIWDAERINRWRPDTN